MSPTRPLGWSRLLGVLLAVLVPGTASTAFVCPDGCFCDVKKASHVPGQSGLKVQCLPLVADVSMDWSSLPAQTIQLDLAKYGLNELTAQHLASMPYLQKLDLQNNQIAIIEEGTFAANTELEVLDLSMNQLEVVQPDRLSCAGMGGPDWAVPRPEIVMPPPLLGQSGIVRLIPHDKQISFRGDVVEIQCQAHKKFPEQKIQWLIRGNPLFPDSHANMSISEVAIPETELHQSTLIVKGVQADHSGEWACFLEDDSNNRANFRSLNVFVASPSTDFCPPFSSKTSRGIYTWGMAIGGTIQMQPCQRHLDNGMIGLAFLLCRENGEWSATVNTSQCAYTNDVTDNLHKFASMNLTLTPKLLLQSSKQFLNFTDNPKVFQDEMDVVYFSQAVENYLPYLSRTSVDLGRYVMSMIENVLHVNPGLMSQAQLRDKACARLLHVVSNVTRVIRGFTHYTRDLAIETYSIKVKTFDGVTCTWYNSNGDNGNYPRLSPGKVFHCSQVNKTVPSMGKVILASVAIPKSIYQQIAQLSPTSPDPLGMVAFDKPNLFPTTMSHPDYNPVTATVIGAHHSQPVGLLNEPVSVVIRSDELHEPHLVQPVIWDPQSNGGFGSWQSKNCQLIRSQFGLIWFTCNKLGYYSFRLSKLTGVVNASGQTLFRYHHPLIYVGAVVCIVLLLVSTVVFGISFHSIQISRQLKHALINVWIGLSSLMFVFAAGIHQTEHHLTCVIVGFVSHYLTLCNLIWIVISVHVIFQKANSFQAKHNRQTNTAFLRPHNEPDGLLRAPDRPLRRPIIRFYLLGWGSSALLCGLVAAFNIAHYTAGNHCFMKLTPFLVSVVVPVALLTAIMIGFSLSAWCVIASSPSQASEHLGSESRSHRTTSMTSVVSNLLPDREKTVRSLLLAHAYIYVLFLSTWMCGSLSVIQPLKGNLPYEELIFAILFTISAISLGVFVFVYFCASRHDVQECWRNPFCVADYLFSGGHHLKQQQYPEYPPPELEISSHLIQHNEGALNSQIGTLNHPSASEAGVSRNAFNVNQDGFQIYDSNLDGDYRHHHHPQPIGYEKIKDTNVFAKDSGPGSDHASLNNANHLRRGYVAPANSVMASDADYGYCPSGNSIFGPSSTKVNNLNIHVDPPTFRRDKLTQKQPQTSSPMAGHHGLSDEPDLTISPLQLQQQQQQQHLPHKKLQVEPEYTESLTIKMGAPCQLASFTTADFPPGYGSSSAHQSSPKNRTSSLPYKTDRHKKQRYHPKHKPVLEDEDAIIRASDFDHLETQSKASSSVYSSRSGRSRKRHKKPTRKKRSRSELEAMKNNSSLMGSATGEQQLLEEDDDYLGEEEDEDDAKVASHEVESPSPSPHESDSNKITAQDIPNRETSV
ncbi:hypothetical protein TCAL_01835 [Tigriopus californicus]|uniref:G-protein coupled receptors family 2 profile 2 domain-containing protein n=1 Tax=Tigriopus californicus TaxID=6832 RepID=A0A553NDE5_TIGCA|nr:hypothetical protein TCAL_01835 [Tigriopus californicus]